MLERFKFQGVLGFRCAILLVQKNLERFSNIHLQNINFEGDNIQSAFPELRRVLEREGQTG